MSDHRLTVSELLALHDAAYRLLLRIDRWAAQDPSWLSSSAVEQLRHGDSCRAWLERRAPELPAELLPQPRLLGPFSELFASFFETSFEVKQTAFESELLDARIKRRRRAPGKIDGVVSLALRHQLARSGVRIELAQARTLCRRNSLRTDSLLLAYIWELERRAMGKSKGPIAHRIWRSIPREIRTSLTEEAISLARERVIEAARTMEGARSADPRAEG
jgi:hypothetical protein